MAARWKLVGKTCFFTSYSPLQLNCLRYIEIERKIYSQRKYENHNSNLTKKICYNSHVFSFKWKYKETKRLYDTNIITYSRKYTGKTV